MLLKLLLELTSQYFYLKMEIYWDVDKMMKDSLALEKTMNLLTLKKNNKKRFKLRLLIKYQNSLNPKPK